MDNKENNIAKEKAENTGSHVANSKTSPNETLNNKEDIKESQSNIEQTSSEQSEAFDYSLGEESDDTSAKSLQREQKEKLDKEKEKNTSKSDAVNKSKNNIDNIAKVNPVKPAKKKKKKEPWSLKKKTILTTIIVVLVCLLSIAGAWAYSFFNTSFEDEDQNQINEELTSVSFDEPFYMLLVGTDTREGGSYKLTDGRSDSCILVRIDPVDYIVSMISIPRDTKTTTEDGYTCKFNELYSSGGIAATIKQVKKMMGVDIAHYAEISFNGLSDMVDAVGGVEVYVPEEIDDPKSGAFVPQGLSTLNGEQALSLSRSRNFADGDFTREADQRVLIKALIDKAFKEGTAGVPNLLKAAKNFVKTDLRLGDMIMLATQFMTADTETKIYQCMIPVLNAGEAGISYVKVDTAALKRMILMMENGEDPSLVEIDSGASVGSSRDAQELAKRQKEYYEQHPDSPGKISNSKSSDKNYNNQYSNDDYGYGYLDYSNGYSTEYYNY